MDEKKLTIRSLAPVLSIAGSDSSGGAGIQADLKTMLANDCYGMSAITALTAQNTMGVTGIMDVTPEFLRKQIDAVFLDIPPKAVKIGMVSDKALINTIAEALEDWHAENIVVDPVMVATSGSRLLKEDAISCLTEPFYFQGSDRYLEEITAAVNIPVLRKDFTVDEYMIYQA